MKQLATHATRLSPHRLRAILASAVLHLVATSVITAAFCSIFINQAALQVMPQAWSTGALRAEMTSSIIVIFGLSTCLWALLVLATVTLKQRARVRKLQALKAARGTIITETLIVMPVFLLLTFGLAQMGINSMAGLLSTVASYEAARTIAVWGPEVGHDRSGNGAVSRAIVEDRGRIAAAGIITPVVPNVAVGLCSPSDSMRKMQAGMLGALAGAPGAPPTSIETFAQAFDTQTFASRGASKFLLAYCATEVTYSGSIITNPETNDRATFTTTVDYAHPAALPLVGIVFARDPGAGPWMTPYVTVMHREYTLTQQLSPNPEVPQSNAFRKLISNLPSPF